MDRVIDWIILRVKEDWAAKDNTEQHQAMGWLLSHEPVVPSIPPCTTLPFQVMSGCYCKVTHFLVHWFVIGFTLIWNGKNNCL